MNASLQSRYTGETTTTRWLVTGFIAGFLGGLAFARFGSPRGPYVQAAFAVLTVAIVALAWIAALV
jgi:hypothetical protein